MKIRTGFRFTLILLFCSITKLNAQADRIWKEQHFGLTSKQQKQSIWAHNGFEMSTNTLNNSILNGAIFSGKIENDALSNLQQANSERSRFNLGAEGQFWYKTKRNKGPAVLFGIEFLEQGIGHVETSLLQLYFQGNGPYEDVIMPLGPSKVSYISQQSAGIGLEWSQKQLSLGATASLVKVSRFQHLSIAEGSSFYTAPFGTSLEANIDLNWTNTSSAQNKGTAWYGTGFSFDMYMGYVSIDKQTSISVQLIDLGMVHFSGIRHNSVDLDTIFKGVQVNNILDFDGKIGGASRIDSLEGLIGLMQTNESSSHLLHGRLQLDFTRRLNDKLSLAMQIRQHFFNVPPQLRLGVAASLTDWLTLEPYAIAGGFTRFNYGLTSKLSPNQSIHFLLHYGLFASQFYPLKSSSQHLYATAVFNF